MTRHHSPEQWRNRAHEARVHAATVGDADCRRIMLGIAAAYEQMAEAKALVDESEALLRTERIKKPFILRSSDAARPTRFE